MPELIHLNLDPDPLAGAGSGGDNGKVEVKEKVVEKVVEKKEEDGLIPFKMPDGEVIYLSGEQAIQAAQYGLLRAKQDRVGKVKKEEEEIEEETDSDRILKLEKELVEFKKLHRHEKDLKDVDSLLDECIGSYKETRENKKLAKKIEVITLAKCNLNPRLNMQKVFKEELEDYLEMAKPPEKTEKEKNETLVRRSMSQTIRGGSAPLVEKEHNFTPADVRTGKSRKALTSWMEEAIRSGS